MSYVMAPRKNENFSVVTIRANGGRFEVSVNRNAEFKGILTDTTVMKSLVDVLAASCIYTN